MKTLLLTVIGCYHDTLAVTKGLHFYGIVSPGKLPYFTAFYEKEGILGTYSNRILEINRTDRQ